MKIVQMLVHAANQVASRVRSMLNGHGWIWVGDGGTLVLFEKRTEHDEFVVIARLAVDEESARDKRFSDVWVPGAVLLPGRWKERVDSDIQWYVPRRQLTFGFQTGGAVPELVRSVERLYEHIEADVQILAGERPLYQIEVEVYFHGECLMLKADTGLSICIDENLAEADEIATSLAVDAVNEARKSWIYQSMAFSAA